MGKFTTFTHKHLTLENDKNGGHEFSFNFLFTKCPISSGTIYFV